MKRLREWLAVRITFGRLRCPWCGWWAFVLMRHFDDYPKMTCPACDTRQDVR